MDLQVAPGAPVAARGCLRGPVRAAPSRPDPLCADLREAIGRSRLWLNLGWKDIRLRYRRTVIGPFWTVLSTATLVGALGFVNATLWHMQIQSYLPFFCAGYISWLLFVTILTESCTSIVNEHVTIQALHIPYLVFTFRLITRNAIVFGHNLLFYVAIALIFQVTPSLKMLLLPVGFVLALANYTWISLLIGVICTRFRDVIQLVANSITLLFFITPIFWHPSQLDSVPAAKFILVNSNFCYHIVDVIRAPLLGEPIDPASIIFLFVSGILGFAVTWAFLRRFYNRIAYWV